MPTATAPPLTTLPLLAEPDAYRPATFPFDVARGKGKPTLADWIQVFRDSVPAFEKVALADESVSDSTRAYAARTFAERYTGILSTLESDPDAELPRPFGRVSVDCVELCRIRDACLREAGFQDAYASIKANENAKALSMLPAVLRELDTIKDARERLESAVRGVLAGNIFDLGAQASIALYEAGADAGQMFTAAKSSLVPRPWAIDNLDDVLAKLAGPAGYHKALVFCDNAGSDVVLGMLPFMRELLLRGIEVVAAVNDVPSINDITLHEMRDVMKEAAQMDATLDRHVREGSFRVLGSGNDLPVIDLRRVSEACAEEARTADLVVLEGMGRSIETNLHVKLTCDRLNLGMIKHPEVAACLDARLYDCVCQYCPAQCHK